MKSIGARLAFWYAVAATLTFASLSIAGYFMLERYLVHDLDRLNEAEFQQIKARLGPGHETLSASVIDERIRETTEYASTLFYIDVHGKDIGTVFRSTNLRGQTIPDVPHERVFHAELPDTGALRVGEFILPPYDVVIATPLHPVSTVMDAYLELCAALMAVMLAVSGALGFWLSRMALRPLRMIQATANRISSDNLSERIPVADVRDEISNVAGLLNQMFDRLESSFNQIRRFTADASHELKTPLSLIRLHAEQLLMGDELTPAQEEALQVQLEEIDRLNKIIEDLLFLSRAEAGVIELDLRSQSPAVFLHTFEQDARVLVEHAGSRCVCTHEGQGEAAFDAKWIRQVLLNLVTNSLAASTSGGRIAIGSVIGPSSWILSVEDQGIGVPEEQRERIFERFVRLGKADGMANRGTGLGLAICRGIVELHGGRIYAVPTSSGRGLRVVFELPATAADRPGAADRLPADRAAAATDRAAGAAIADRAATAERPAGPLANRAAITDRVAASDGAPVAPRTAAVR
jgi:signal transduction histidine kinase